MSTAVADPIASPSVAIPATPETAIDTSRAIPATPPVSAEAAKATPPVAAKADAQPTEVKAPTRLLSDDAAKAKATEPAKAEWSLKAPEGVEMPEAELKAAETFAKELGVSQAQAEKILARDLSAKSAAQAALKTEAETIGDTWLKQSQEHPEIGGKNLDGAVANAKRVLAVIATPEERQAIADSPFANNPLFLAMMNRAAKLLPAEDTLHPSGGAEAPTLNPAQILYPNKYR